MSQTGLKIVHTETGSLALSNLKDFAKEFREKWSPVDVQFAVEQHLLVIRSQAEKRYAKNLDRDVVDEYERKRLGAELFDQFHFRFRLSIGKFENLLTEFLFWMNNWWRSNAELNREVLFVDRDAIYKSANRLADEFVLPVLPVSTRCVFDDAHFEFGRAPVEFVVSISGLLLHRGDKRSAGNT